MKCPYIRILFVELNRGTATAGPIVTTNPIHWFVSGCGDSDLAVYRWNSERANAAGARHYCGEAHAEVYIRRWFDSVCAPPKPSFT
jgi:hypothetical protein